MVKKIQIQNIDIYYEKISKVDEFSIFIECKQGSAFENDKQRGYSHFVEHMLFKGTKKRDHIEIVKDLENEGAQINAYTTKYNTVYYVRALSKSQEKVYDILLDLYVNSTFLEKEFNKEKNVILEEINMYDDSVENRLYTNDSLKIYEGDFKYPVLGTKESISKSTRDELFKFYKEKYTKQRTSIYISGKFDIDLLEKKVNAYMKNLKSNENDNVSKTSFNDGNYIFFEQNNQVNLLMTYNLKKLTNKEQNALSLLKFILGGGMSSYLFVKIREELALAYSTYVYTEESLDETYLKIYVGTNKKMYKKAIKGINDMFKELSEGIPDENYKRALNIALAKSILLKYNTSYRITQTLSVNNKIGKPLSLEKIVKRLEDVSKEDILKLIDKIIKCKKAISISGNIDEKL